jgi:hypothetical protein
LRHDLPKFRLTDHDISAELSSPSKRFDRFEQPFGRQPTQSPYPSSPTAFQSQPDAQKAFHQPAFAGPCGANVSSLWKERVEALGAAALE